MHGGLPADYIELDSDKIIFFASRVMPNDTCEVPIAVGERQWRADSNDITDDYANAVSGQVLDVSELLQRRSVFVPSQHD